MQQHDTRRPGAAAAAATQHSTHTAQNVHVPACQHSAPSAPPPPRTTCDAPCTRLTTPQPGLTTPQPSSQLPGHTTDPLSHLPALPPGPLPASLSKASSLLYLVLDGNALSGSIPPLPRALTFLNLTDNQLSGSLPSLPASMGGFEAGLNRLTGTIPQEVSKAAVSGAAAAAVHTHTETHSYAVLVAATSCNGVALGAVQVLQGWPTRLGSRAGQLPALTYKLSAQRTVQALQASGRAAASVHHHSPLVCLPLPLHSSAWPTPPSLTCSRHAAAGHDPVRRLQQPADWHNP